jgi:hypothetical protein
VLSLKDNKLGTKEAGEVLGNMLKGNSVLKELDLSKNSVHVFQGGDAPGFAQGISKGLAGNGAMTALNISSNSIVSDSYMKAPRKGIKVGELIDGKPVSGEEDSDGYIKVLQLDGIKAIAGAIPDMRAILSVNLLKNAIPVEQAQALVKIMQSKKKLITLCGLSGNEATLDFSNQGLGSGDAVLIANDIRDMGALHCVDGTLYQSKKSFMMSTHVCCHCGQHKTQHTSR